MKLKLSIFIALIFSGQLYIWGKGPVLTGKEKKPVRFSDVRKISLRLKKNDLVKNLRDFVRCGRPNRMVGGTGHASAEKCLLEAIQKADLGKGNITWVDSFKPDIPFAKKLYRNDFEREIKALYKPSNPTYRRWKKYTDSMVEVLSKRSKIMGKNILWEKKGNLSPNDIMVIGAHYDTIGVTDNYQKIDEKMATPGADDNASGVAVALGIIRLLSQMDLPKTVRVVFFDFGELGMLGSRAFVQKYKQEFKEKNFIGYLNLEMLGHDSKKFDKLKRLGNMKLYIRKKTEKGHQADLKLAKLFTQNGKKVNGNVRFEVLANSFQHGDNVSFWQEGLVALAFTGDWENDFNGTRYHSANDFVETLNLKTLYGSFRYISGALIAWAFDILK